ncbi:MAG: hypothetical protein IPI65_16855 [Bacteroidetes bacterium]|nr:hypothetical protein [Bacteroidota bacterium]
MTDIFTITSGLEILLPKAFRDKIGNIILNNPDSFFTVTVLDLVQKPLLSADEKEQEVIQKYLRKKSKAEIIKELLNLKDTAPEEYTINHKTYKRDNYTITLIKKIRGYKCQICGNSDNILPKFTSHRKYIITGYIAEGYGLISLDDRHEFSNYTSANNFLGSRVKSVVTR